MCGFRKHFDKHKTKDKTLKRKTAPKNPKK